MDGDVMGLVAAGLTHPQIVTFDDAKGHANK
jgi:hypothetical protein